MNSPSFTTSIPIEPATGFFFRFNLADFITKLLLWPSERLSDYEDGVAGWLRGIVEDGEAGDSGRITKVPTCQYAYHKLVGPDTAKLSHLKMELSCC